MKLNKLNRIFITKSGWSIYVTKTDNPFNFKLDNFSTLSIFDIDVEAKGVADPFLVKTDNKYYLFFEIEVKNAKGVIALASSNDGLKYKYEKRLL